MPCAARTTSPRSRPGTATKRWHPGSTRPLPSSLACSVSSADAARSCTIWVPPLAAGHTTRESAGGQLHPRPTGTRPGCRGLTAPTASPTFLAPTARSHCPPRPGRKALVENLRADWFAHYGDVLRPACHNSLAWPLVRTADEAGKCDEHGQLFAVECWRLAVQAEREGPAGSHGDRHDLVRAELTGPCPARAGHEQKAQAPAFSCPIRGSGG